MSQLYDSLEPSVIDKKMLHNAVMEQGPKGEAGQIAAAEDIDFVDVKELRLDFKNILKIENIWHFTNLAKLQLDNNIIEKIEGLDVLTELIWLDLSFNNIEVIEGLDKLTKLRDLSLYNNRISKIENLHNLKALQILSLGNNNLTELEDIKYLRQIRSLKTLNLSGNKLCERDIYKVFIFAYISWLEYLDYRLVDQQSKIEAMEKYQIALDEIVEKEKKEEAHLGELERKRKEFLAHKAAYVDGLGDDTLFRSLYEDDPDGNKLNKMPGIQELVDAFKEKFMAICTQIFEYGHEENKKMMAEVDEFWECLNEAKNENKEMGMKAIDDFMELKQQVFNELTKISDQQILDTKISDYLDEISNLWTVLMGLEMQLVDQLEDIIKEFDRSLQDMVGTFTETVQAYLAQCRDLENQHNEKMMESTMVNLEKAVRNEIDAAEITDDLRALFVDKDTAINAVTSSHEIHLLKIDNKEDYMQSQIKLWMKQLTDKIHNEEEIIRNRERVLEINNFLDHLRDEVESTDFHIPL